MRGPTMLRYCPIVGLVIISLVSSQYDYVSECPEENGFFADALQCDRYYECRDGVVHEEFCADGLVFDEASNSYAKCGFPFSIDCTGRDELQPAQPTPGCQHQHGYFSVPDETVCNKFNFCVDGVPNTITCAGGLIFDPEKGQCGYSDQTTRAGCTSGDLFGFQCPEQSAQGYSRHSDPEDCQYFYLCIDGKARRNGCSIGDVFDPVSLSCQRQDKVEGPCGSWYNQTFKVQSLQIDLQAKRTEEGQAGQLSQEGNRWIKISFQRSHFHSSLLIWNALDNQKSRFQHQDLVRTTGGTMREEEGVARYHVDNRWLILQL